MHPYYNFNRFKQQFYYTILQYLIHDYKTTILFCEGWEKGELKYVIYKPEIIAPNLTIGLLMKFLYLKVNQNWAQNIDVDYPNFRAVVEEAVANVCLNFVKHLEKDSLISEYHKLAAELNDEAARSGRLKMEYGSWTEQYLKATKNVKQLQKKTKDLFFKIKQKFFKTELKDLDFE